MVVTVAVIGLRGEKVEIDLCDTEEQFKSITVLQLREKIIERLYYQDFPEEIRLIFIHRSLDQYSSLLSAYGIKHMSVIHVVERIRGGGDGRLEPGKGDGGMGDKGGKNRSKEQLLLF